MKTDGLIDNIYKVLFESIGEGLIIVKGNGQIISANPRATELFGYSTDELLQMKVEELIPLAARSKHTEHRDNFNKQPHKRRMGQNMNLKALKKNNDEFDVEISLNHFQSEGETLVVAVITDVTERVRQQRQIQELNANLEEKVEQRTREVVESQKLYSAIAKNFPNGTINVFDQELKYLFVEGLELQELGLNKEKLIGTSYLDKISQEIRPKIESELTAVFEGQNKYFELEHLEQVYRINAVPLSNGGGIIDKILVVEENITEQKMVEKQREEALQKERQLNEMKSRFVSMASHEFRTPLSTVLSSVSLCEKYIEKGQLEKTEKHIKRVKGAVAGLTEILNDFLSVEKLESNKSVVQKSQFNYFHFATEMVEEMEAICKSEQTIAFVHNGAEELNSDSKILKNILYNLLSNAIKYSKEGDTIEFRSSLDNEALKIEIEDHGIGIPQEEQSDMFGRFFRAKNAFNIKGTGLGLNIVKKYVEMLHGDITFTSELNKGTTFFVTIPITKE